MNRRDLLGALGAAFAAPVFARTKPAPQPTGSAVLLPMRLGIESLRIARGWCQVGMDLEAQAGAAAIQKSAASFQNTYSQFRAAAPKLGQQEAALLFEQHWRVYRMSFSARPDASVARRVLSLSDELLGLARKSGAGVAQQVGGNAALYLRAADGAALIERMMRLMLSRQWGVGAADVPITINEDRAAFAKLLGDLAATPGASPEMLADVKLAQQQWGFFERALAPGADAAAAREMLKLGARMGEAMESVLTHLPA
jgi:hypothetical protein